MNYRQIRILRLLENLDQWEVAKAMNRSQAYLSYLETGRRDLHSEEIPFILAAIKKAKLQKGIQI